MTQEIVHWQPGLARLRESVARLSLLTPHARDLVVEDLGRFWAATYRARGGRA